MEIAVAMVELVDFGGLSLTEGDAGQCGKAT